jgi:signal transduction histidine kinase
MPNLFIRITVITSSILTISLLHYLTPLRLHYLHDIFQRLYYLPIILAALWYGLRGGLCSAIAVSIAYAPHILFQWGGEISVEMEKYLEIVLYNIVGGLTGILAQREQEKSLALEKSAAILEGSYRQLQSQSEHIISVEEALRRSEKLATLGEMAAVLAHEIRNPLGSIRGTAEILRDDYSPGDPKHEFIEIQIRETERLNRVVEDFLRMARQQPVELKSCQIKTEIETIVAIVSTDAKIRNVGVNLIPIDQSLRVKGDGEKLRQAFLNVIINALHATLPGGMVTISAEQAGTACKIQFCDTGSGIDKDTAKRIFEPFFTTKADGTGLGLAITQKIVAAHNGELTINSNPGIGTTLTITLPLQDDSGQNDKKRPA